MMKYFTLDGWIGDQDQHDDGTAAHRVVSQYRAYLESVTASLPADLQLLLSKYCIHDGHLRRLAVSPSEGTVVLRLDAGDSSMREARDLSLQYCGVSEVESTSDPSRGLPGPHGYGDLGNDEIEMLPNGEY